MVLVTHTERVGIVGEFVVNVTVALCGVSTAGTGVSGGLKVTVKIWNPPAGMFEAVGGNTEKLVALGPVITIPVMFNGCDCRRLLI